MAAASLPRPCPAGDPADVACCAHTRALATERRMTTFPDISISTERLVLRAYEDTDIPELTDMMNDDLVTAWPPVPQPYTEADARAFATESAPAERAEGHGI